MAGIGVVASHDTIPARIITRSERLEDADFVHIDDSGLIDNFRVMIHPLKELQALVEAMGAQLPRAMAQLGITPEQMT